jgi:hypothetical protein
MNAADALRLVYINSREIEIEDHSLSLVRLRVCV